MKGVIPAILITADQDDNLMRGLSPNMHSAFWPNP